MSETPDAAKIAGLLADPDRRAVVAALILGASDIDGVVERAGLDARAVHDAVARLVSGGLVVSRAGALVLLDASFGLAARGAATVSEPASTPTEKILRSFVANDRLISIPVQRSKRQVVLEVIAQDFEPGLKYTEDEVNAIVGRWHDDYAAIRRHLIDESFLDRHDGSYWRSGGPVHDL